MENGEETTYTLAFMYDNNGDIFGFYYNDTPYYYIKNAQNDVVMVVNTDGVAEILYFYDAWGNISNCYEMPGSNMSEINPLTYRSYYYDAELGMYYLNSRYYMPTLCRFLNADGCYNTHTGMLSHNMFTYCNNNPVNMFDEDGNSPGSIAKKMGGLAAAAAAVIGGILGGLEIAAAVLIGVALAGVVIAVGEMIPETTASVPIEDKLTNTAKSYGRLKCKEAADAMTKELKKNKKKGTLVILHFSEKPGFVMSERLGDKIPISENGMHYGVLYNDKVYCNIYPEGQPYDEWKENFYDFWDSEPVVEFVPIE